MMADAAGRRTHDRAASFFSPRSGYLPLRMFPNLVQLVTRRPPPEYDRGFVEEVRVVRHVRSRNPRVGKLFLACWLLIAGKCTLVIWLINKYHMPFSPWWVNGPTVAFALMCTAIYFFRE
jgi:hypothetical protein